MIMRSILSKCFNLILDTTIAKFAITLEHLEEAFYTFGLNKFNDIAFLNQGYTPLVRQRFVEILAHEKDHVALLTTVLGDQTPKPCNYKLCVFFFFGRGGRMGF